MEAPVDRRVVDFHLPAVIEIQFVTAVEGAYCGTAHLRKLFGAWGYDAFPSFVRVPVRSRVDIVVVLYPGEHHLFPRRVLAEFPRVLPCEQWLHRCSTQLNTFHQGGRDGNCSFALCVTRGQA